MAKCGSDIGGCRREAFEGKDHSQAIAIAPPDAQPPYGGSHRLRSSAATGDGHGATQPGGASPKAGGSYVFAPVWTALFGR